MDVLQDVLCMLQDAPSRTGMVDGLSLYYTASPTWKRQTHSHHLMVRLPACVTAWARMLAGL
ncbi:MAG: hypothetical protein ACPIOQ_53315 [Promethearchaeia archaeon]